jgi:hypothetical protein
VDIAGRNGALSASDHDHLVRLLASVPAARRWAVEHRQAALLCVLGILDAPDAGYANAARRRFADPLETRERALALIAELDRELATERYEQRRSARRGRFPGVRLH